MVSKITILGLGNLLLKDDGVGPRVIEALQEQGLPLGVEAVEMRGPFYYYWDTFAHSKAIIAVDALRGGNLPGTVYIAKPEEFDENTSYLAHEDQFLTVVNLLKKYGLCPDITILGVEPKEICLSLELSPEVARQVQAIVNIIKGLCQRMLIQQEQFSELRGGLS